MRLAGLTAGLAAVMSIGLTGFMMTISADIGGVIELVRAGTRGWLIGIGSGIHIGDTAVTLIPLGAVMLAIAVVAWSARTMLSAPTEQPLTYILTTAGCYAILAAIGAIVSATPGVSISFLRAAVAGAIVGGLGAIAGIATRQELLAGVPARAKRILRGGVLSAAVVVAAAAGLVLTMFVLNLSRAAELWAGLDPGGAGGLGAGGIGLGLLCLLLAPNLIAWTVAVLLGPGIALGTGTSIDLTGAHVDSVPGLPILAALPAPGQFPGWVFILGLIPLIGGVCAGLRMREGSPSSAMIDGAAAGVVGGCLLGVITALSAGAAGDGRMSDIGPALLQPGLIALVAVGLGGLIGAAIGTYLSGHYRGARDGATDRGPGIGIGKHLTSVIRRGS